MGFLENEVATILPISSGFIVKNCALRAFPAKTFYVDTKCTECLEARWLSFLNKPDSSRIFCWCSLSLRDLRIFAVDVSAGAGTLKMPIQRWLGFCWHHQCCLPRHYPLDREKHPPRTALHWRGAISIAPPPLSPMDSTFTVTVALLPVRVNPKAHSIHLKYDHRHRVTSFLLIPPTTSYSLTCTSKEALFNNFFP